MKTLIVLVVIAAYVANVFAQDCSQATTCATCTSTATCGWCAATQQCLSGKADKTGPAVGFCYNSWHQGAGSCPACTAFKDCRSCSIWNSDCVWCQPGTTGGSCQNVGQIGCPAITACPCEELSTCSECVTEGSCNWCTGNSVCLRETDMKSQCNGSRITNGTCPCSIYKTCDGCRNGFGCQWCDDTGTCEAQGGRPTCQIAHSACSTYCKNLGVDCLACNGLSGCAWCETEALCVDQDSTGCNFISHTCPNCANHEFCGSCMDEPGCTWCEDGAATPRCQPNATAKCERAPSCAAFCIQFTNCGLCNQFSGCAWCDEGVSGYCADLSGKCSFYAHGCSPTPIKKPTHCKSFDGGSFVGGMFLVIGLLILGVGGFMFYRYKTGKKMSYQELR